jgi:Delta7-sterol 5-desaturase
MQPILNSIADQFGLLPVGVIMASVVFLRYLVMAGGVYLLCYVWLTQAVGRYKIQPKTPQRQVVLAEVRHSFYSALVFGSIATGLFVARQYGYTQHYLNVSDYGWAYFIASFVGLVFIHDAYFYWMHRLMHQPRLFRLVHGVHHQSVNPTPMAALSFHPLEAVLEFAFLPVVVWLLPVHPAVLLLLSLWSMGWNIVGHLGYELFPAGFTRHWLGQWFNTATHHNLHHQRVKGNYGLYFNIWDRLMHTNHPDYFTTFDTIKARQ